MNDEQTLAALDQYVEYLAGRSTLPDLAALPPTQQQKIKDLWATADLLWEAGTLPPIEDDPVAVKLGLVPDPTVILDPAKVTRWRKKASLKPSAIADILRSRGWDVSASQVFNWQQQEKFDVPPALIKALAAVLGAEAEQLVSPADQSALEQELSELLRDDRFEAIVTRWAKLTGLDTRNAQIALQSKMLSTVRRGEQLTNEQWIRVLTTLVEAKESRPRYSE